LEKRDHVPTNEHGYGRGHPFDFTSGRKRRGYVHRVHATDAHPSRLKALNDLPQGRRESLINEFDAIPFGAQRRGDILKAQGLDTKKRTQTKTLVWGDWPD
jgi:IS5 family transposase